MNNTISRKWYEKKRYIVPASVVGTLLIVSIFGDNSTTYTSAPVQPVSVQAVTPTDAPASTYRSAAQPVTQTAQQPTTLKQQAVTAQPSSSFKITPTVQPTPSYEDDVQLSNDNYYTNSQGNEVHSPAYAPSEPAGASARCRDGTYSFSQSRRGACSHHGGVAQWL